jgi:putative peptidoglycan lipid II flippase
MWPLQHMGLALATGIAAWVNAIILYVRLNREGKLKVSKQVKTIIARVTMVSAIMGITVFASYIWLDRTLSDLNGFARSSIEVSLLILLGIIVYVTLGQFMGAISIAKIKHILLRGKNK